MKSEIYIFVRLGLIVNVVSDEMNDITGTICILVTSILTYIKRMTVPVGGELNCKQKSLIVFFVFLSPQLLTEYEHCILKFNFEGMKTNVWTYLIGNLHMIYTFQTHYGHCRSSKYDD